LRVRDASTSVVGTVPAPKLLLATCCVVFAVLTIAPLATAVGDTARVSTIASYCSPSGDICYGIFDRSGQIILRITTAAHYFSRYTLCVTRLPRSSNPEHAQRCGAFPLFRSSGSSWSSSVNFARQYVGGAQAPHPLTPLPGRYRVTWRQVCQRCDAKAQRHSGAGQPLGPALFFRLPIP
jgi:hypothetical protein